MKLKSIVFLLVVLLVPVATQASLTRSASLGVTLGESDWLIQDSGSIFYNPAYVNMYGGLLEGNTLDADGNDIYGSVMFKLSKKITFGISIGMPIASRNDLNEYATAANLSSVNLYSRMQNAATTHGYLINATALTAGGAYATAAANAPIALSDNLNKYDAMLHFGMDFDTILFGVNVSYAGVSSDTSTTYTDPATPTLNSSTENSAHNRELGLKAGLLFKNLGPIKNFAVDTTVTLPSLSRKNEKLQIATGDTVRYTREIASDGAIVLGLGTTGDIATSKRNSLRFRLSFLMENYSVKQKDYLDNNANGLYSDGGGEQKLEDTAERKYTTILIGVSDRLNIVKDGFVFAAVYFKTVTGSLKISGTQETATAIVNYADPYNAEISETSIPIIIGGEFSLAKWLVSRFSIRKEFVLRRNTTLTVDDYSNNAANTLLDTTKTETINSTEGNTTLSVGLTIAIGNFKLDWLLNRTWISDGGALSSSGANANFDNVSTQFSLSWKFGGSSRSTVFSKEK